MRKILWVGIACVVALGALTWVGATRVQASDGVHRLGNSPIGRLISGRIGRAMVLKSDMNVSDEQREQIKAILLTHRAEILAAAKPVVDKQRVLRDAVLAEKPDDKTIHAAASDLGSALGDAAVAAAKIKSEVAKVLTPGQLKLLDKFHADNDEAIGRWLKELESIK